MKKRLVRTLLLILAGLMAGFLLGEIGLRVAGISYHSFYTYDEYRGIALRSGTEGWHRKENEVYLRINSDGLRDREHTIEKPPDTLRIAVLGDSFAQAREVPMENAFWAVM
ncbi:MAG: SGNH/GDSL hydrolase family protein, partial [Nitrospinota bacterium]